jgi:hypothetical protein
MAESAVAEIKSAPKEFTREPWKAIAVGFIFLLLVLIIEAFKPGLITGPIKSLLAMVGLKSS